MLDNLSVTLTSGTVNDRTATRGFEQRERWFESEKVLNDVEIAITTRPMKRSPTSLNERRIKKIRTVERFAQQPMSLASRASSTYICCEFHIHSMFLDEVFHDG